MKHISSAIVAAGLIVGLAGCGPKDDAQPVTAAPEPPAAQEQERQVTVTRLPKACGEWVAWLVDGNGHPPRPTTPLIVNAVALQQIARACLSRDPDPDNWHKLPASVGQAI